MDSDTIHIILRITFMAITILGSIWNIYFFLAKPELRDFKFKLVVLLTSADLFLSIIRLISMIVDIQKEDSFLCIFQVNFFKKASSNLIFEMAIFSISWIFTRVLYKMIVKNK